MDDPVAVGLSLGGTGHAVGTGTAFRYGSVAGAMGGLAIGVTGILYVFVSPIVASLDIELKKQGIRVPCFLKIVCYRLLLFFA